MTIRGKERATSALLNAWTYTGKRFPYIYVVGDHVFFSRGAAERQQLEYAVLYGETHEVEIMHFEEAFATVSRNGIADWEVLVDFNIYGPKMRQDNSNHKVKLV